MTPRRLLFPLALALLAVPLLAQFVAPATRGMSAEELRPLAAPPGRDGWTHLLAQTDAWLRDHFGLRRALIGAHARLVHGLLGIGNADVLIGPTGRPFLRENAMIEQSAGLRLDRAGVLAAADMLAALRAALAAQGATLLVAPPPNASTIDAADLPAWARNPGRPTEYDLLLAALAARGVPALDLRPAMRALQRVEDPYRRTDSHWTPRGALAAFNAIAAAAGRPDWHLAPAVALTPPLPLAPGDLVRLLDLAGVADERLLLPALEEGTAQPLDRTPWGGVLLTLPDPRGPMIVLLGDSFTRAYFPPMVLARTGRVAWVHHDDCGFDFALVARLRPAQVWYLPTERRIACAAGRYPAGLAAAAARASTGASAR
ncbi:MAG: hypothetical protein M0Z28_23580 [Rhodospirillales bacterium]|nr:hypothetical protein [Rhodospirillales bacterium]